VQSGDSYTFQHVLLIDDSEIDVLVNRRLMELTRFAENVSVTTTAEEALQYLREECTSEDRAPDLIFLDVYLPMMNGYEFLQEFSKMPEPVRRKTRIIVLSVFQKPEQRQKMLEFPNVYGQIDKPLTREALTGLAENKEVLVAQGKDDVQ